MINSIIFCLAAAAIAALIAVLAYLTLQAALDELISEEATK